MSSRCRHHIHGADLLILLTTASLTKIKRTGVSNFSFWQKRKKKESEKLPIHRPPPASTRSNSFTAHPFIPSNSTTPSIPIRHTLSFRLGAFPKEFFSRQHGLGRQSVCLSVWLRALRKGGRQCGSRRILIDSIEEGGEGGVPLY